MQAHLCGRLRRLALLQSTAMVQYQVTNESRKTHTLMMIPVPGITQITTAGNCSNPFTLGYH